MGKILILCCAAVLFSFSCGRADETVYLKNGKYVSGKIVEKSAFAIKMEIKGINTTYLLSEIDRVVSGQVKEESGNAGDSGKKETKENLLVWELYYNEEFGFSLRLPVNWMKRVVANPDKDIYLVLNRSRSFTEDIPGVSVTVSLLLKEGDPEDFIGYLIGNAEGFLRHKSAGAKFTVIERAQPVKVGSLDGVKMIVDYSSLPLGPDKPPLQNIRMVSYSFYLKDMHNLLTIAFFAHGDVRLESEMEQMKPVLDSLLIVNPAGMQQKN